MAKAIPLKVASQAKPPPRRLMCHVVPNQRGGGVLQRAALVEALVPSADAPGEAQEHEDGGGGEEKVKANAAAAPSRPRKQLPGKAFDVSIQALATSVGKGSDDVWEGTERGPGGVIVNIKWAGMGLTGSLPVVDWGMPHLAEFDVARNRRLIGDLDKVAWPPGLTSVNLGSCLKLTGRIDEVQWPETLTSMALAGCCELEGDISVAHFPAGLKVLDLRGCRRLTGRIDEVQWPNALTSIYLYNCYRLTGLKTLDLRCCSGLIDQFTKFGIGTAGDKRDAKAKLEAAGCEKVWL